MSNVTMSQIADVANVSRSTVSFVLNDRQRNGGSIGEETAQRVRQVAQELGYRPNRSARALVTGKTNLIGLAMWNLERAHYASVTECVQKNLESSQKHLLISCLKCQMDQNDPCLLDSIFPWPLDGVLTLSADEVLANYWKKFKSWPAPVVNMGRMAQYLNNVDSVEVDLSVGIHQAMEHLLQIGCRRIALAVPIDDIQNKKTRTAAYEKSLQRTNMPMEHIALKDSSRAYTRQIVHTYIAKNGCPDGIMCFNDDVAIGCYYALRDMNIKIPEQVALVGCDGIEDTEYQECPITTIVQPIEEMCRLAWELLQERIKDPERPYQQKVLLPQLAVRESTLYFGGK